VTVLTAVRNGARYLEDAISSVQTQTFDDWEHIVVDDDSEDGSVEIVDNAAAADPRVRLLRRSERGGPYVAANDGLEIARGKYVARLDADDVAPPHRLEIQLDYLAGRPDLRACGGFHQMMAGSEIAARVSRTTTSPGVLRWRLTAAGGPTHSTAFVEKSAMDELGGYAPLPLAQDLRMWCQLSERNWLGIVPEVVAYRRSHEGSVGRRAGLLQFQLAIEASRDHLERISGERWSLDDVSTLWDVVRKDPATFPEGLHVLDRWAALWRRDPQLSTNELNELDAWTNRRRRLLAKGAWRTHPVSAAAALARMKLNDVQRRLRARLAVAGSR
jgi:glycosyltransferase involved in cell wall biosynthesis